MIVRWKLFVLIVAGILAMSSCKDDLVEMEQIAEEQTDQDVVHRRSCGLDHKMESLMQDPEFEAAHKAKFTRINQALEEIKSRSSCGSPTIVPIAIHFQGVTNPDQACLVALAQTQVDILNKDFTGTNTDIGNWTNQASSSFPGVSNGEACLQFCIADKNHPTGYGVANGSPAVTINATTGDTNSDWSGYINVFVQTNTGLLGYSPLGGSGNGDGVVVDASAFGSGGGCGNVSASAPFNLGRTLTHELGHYLLLDHIWGDGCNVDDDVADTPDQQSEYYDCPSQGASSCGSNDMHMSYMDYVNDACMYMFSAGQTARMEAYINSSLSNVTSNVSNVCSVGGGNTGGGSGGTGGGTTSTCDKPGTAVVSNLSPTSVKVDWTAITDAIKYRIRYRKIGTTTWTANNVNAATATIQNLDAATDYQYQLRTQCPAGWTNWTSTSSFTTDMVQASTCGKPSAGTVQSINPTKVKVTWDAVTNAIRYRIRFRAIGTSEWTVFSPANPSRFLSNLNPGTDYQYQLRTRCPSGWTGWTGMNTFTTEGASNTTNEVTVKVVLDEYGSETTWELVDDNGNAIATDGPFQDGQAGTVKTKTFDLEEGCFTLYLDDSYGDGICCDYGDGYLQLIVDGVVIDESDGQFGYYDYIDFCITEDGFRQGKHKKDNKKPRLKAKHPPRISNN